MSDAQTPRRPDPDDIALIEEIQQLQGEEMPIDQDAVLDPDEIEQHRTPTLTEFDRGEPAFDADAAGSDVASLDGLAGEELREGETDDPDVAAEEGLTYVPPIDPPTRPDREEPGGVDVAAGAAVSDLTARIREALEADAATTDLADRLVIGTRGSTVVVRGVVDDINDTDNIAAVIERVPGVEIVIDETELAEG